MEVKTRATYSYKFEHADIHIPLAMRIEIPNPFGLGQIPPDSGLSLSQSIPSIPIHSARFFGVKETR